jgi:uncharacterized protein (TIGR02246 family)
VKKLIAVIPLVFLICFAFSCQPGKEAVEKVVADLSADIEANKNLNEAWDEAYNAGNIEGLLALYTEDAITIPPNEPPYVGKEAIRAHFQQAFDQFTEETDSVVVDVKISGDLAFVRGTWKDILTPKAGGETLNLNGSFVAINQKQTDGAWKTICETYSNEQLVFPSQEKK